MSNSFECWICKKEKQEQPAYEFKSDLVGWFRYCTDCWSNSTHTSLGKSVTHLSDCQHELLKTKKELKEARDSLSSLQAMLPDAEVERIAAYAAGCIASYQSNNPHLNLNHSHAQKFIIKTTEQAIQSALALVRKNEDWQPIESAPKDGSVILVYAKTISGGTEHWRTCAAWFDTQFESTGFSRGNHLKYRGAWTDGTVADWGMQFNNELQPIHWMPLPKPPTLRTAIDEARKK